MQHFDELLKHLKSTRIMMSQNDCSNARSYVRHNTKFAPKRITRKNEKCKKRRPRGVKNLNQFATALFEVIENNRNSLFTCLVCGQILNTPVTVDCGHTFCAGCLCKLTDNTCCECHVDITTNSVNVLVNGIITKWKESKNNKLGNAVVPTKDLLGFEPRYHLRSRFVGLVSKSGNVNQILQRLLVSKHCKTPLDKFLRRTSKLKYIESSRPSNYIDKSSRGATNHDNQLFLQAAENIFLNIQAIEDQSLRERWSTISSMDFDCILCSRCLFDPVTTSCGHTFCRECLARVFDHGLNCPLCMSSLNVQNQSRGTTTILQQAVRILLPKDYKERICINKSENIVFTNEFEIPMFICTNAFPGVACPLYVYEPRYRLLTRRCLQSQNKKFGMAMKIDDTNKFATYGTLLEVCDAVNLEDGRCILTTIGLRRFKVVGRSEKDGYDIALVKYIRDLAVPLEKSLEVSVIHDRVHSKASRWVSSLSPNVLAEVERSFGKMPPVENNWINLPDGPSWTWWLMPILPVSSHLQIGFLSSTSLEKRLRAIDKMLDHMNIRMRALERNSVNTTNPIKSSDSCSFNEGPVEQPF